MKESTAVRIATGFGIIRLLPKAPGTAGSLLGLPLGFAMHFALAGLAGPVGFLAMGTVLIVALSCAAVPVVRIAGSVFGRPDDGRIVVDEILGQALAVFYFEPNWWMYGCLFAAFRLFDILKPWPIRWIDRKWHHPLGVIVDDLLAGVYAGVMVFLFTR